MKPFLFSLLPAVVLLPTVTFAQGVGIGISTPSAGLHVVSDVQYNTVRLASSSTYGTWLNLPNTATGGREWGFISTAAGNGEGAGNFLLRDNTAAAVRLQIGSTGFVGISTEPARTRLSLSPSALEPKITLFDNGSTTAHDGFGVSNGQLNYHVPSASDSHVFYTGGKNGDGTELLRIQGNGRVGVGTSSPTSTLQVAGSVAASIRSLGSGTIADTDYTVLLTGNVALPAPSASNTGRLYHLLNATAGNVVVTGTLHDVGTTATLSTFTLNTTSGNKGITVQSNGTYWWILTRE